MKSSKKVPGDRDMRAIPRWARVALAAHTVRRVQPLLLVSWPKATKKSQRGVEWAIAEGESAATQGSPTPDLKVAFFREYYRLTIYPMKDVKNEC